MHELKRYRCTQEKTCAKCNETIEVGDIFVIYDKQPLCELCVEDYEEEGRPIW